MQAPTRLLTKKVDMPGSRLERYSGQVCATVILTIGIACGLLLKEDTGMSEPWNSIGEVRSVWQNKTPVGLACKNVRCLFTAGQRLDVFCGLVIEFLSTGQPASAVCSLATHALS